MSAGVRLQDLPSELIVEILKELDWRDLLFIRQTCKLLSELSKSLVVWRNLFSTYTSEPGNFPWRRLERPLASYPSTELEHTILRFKSAEIGWTRDDKFPARQRALNLRVPQSRPFHLLEGGRWVLFATTGGSVEYVDLDAKDLVERNLIPTQTSGSSTKIALDIDYSEPVLTFYLALSISTRHEELIQIWKVTLMVEGDNGTGGALSAQKLASFAPDPNRPLEGFSIGGPYIVYYTWLQNHDPETHLAVVNWKDHLRRADHSEPVAGYPMRIISNHLNEKVNAVLFLPKNILFISTSLRTLFYDIQLIPESATFQVPPGPIAPILEHRITCSLISRPFIHGDLVRFVFSDDASLRGMVIDLGGTLPEVQFHKLMDLPSSLFRGVMPCLGYKRGAFTRRSGGIVVFSYAWPDEKDDSSPSIVTKMFSREDWTGRVRGIDELSGRVLLEPFILSKAVIALDFALLYRRQF